MLALHKGAGINPGVLLPSWDARSRDSHGQIIIRLIPPSVSLENSIWIVVASALRADLRPPSTRGIRHQIRAGEVLQWAMFDIAVFNATTRIAARHSEMIMTGSKLHMCIALLYPTLT